MRNKSHLKQALTSNSCIGGALLFLSSVTTFIYIYITNDQSNIASKMLYHFTFMQIGYLMGIITLSKDCHNAQKELMNVAIDTMARILKEITIKHNKEIENLKRLTKHNKEIENFKRVTKS